MTSTRSAPSDTAVRGLRTRIPGFVALLLTTAGVLVLIGRAVPVLGDALALVLGVEILLWARTARDDALLVTGGVLTGIGSAILLAAWPLRHAEPHVVGATFLLALAGGFTLVALLSTAWLRRPQPWSWPAAAGAAIVGAGLLTGPSRLQALLAWGLPALLLAGGAVAGLLWIRSVRR